MPYRKVSLVAGEFFHIYNKRFVKLLYLSNSTKGVNFRDDIVEKNIDAWDFERGDTLVSIGAWVLMPNHFHIYLTSPTPSPTPGVGEKESWGNITLFMNKLSTSYVKYFNKKYNRTGALFEGNFKAVHIEDDNQAKYLFSYIHLNPIKLIDSTWKVDGIKNKDKAFAYLNNYKWSSYNDHFGISRPENKILQLNDFPDYFSNIKDFNSEILFWLQYKQLPLSPG